MKKKRIALVEFINNHYDFVLASYRLIKNKNNDVYIFLDKSVYDNLKEEMKDYSFNIDKDRILVFDGDKSIKNCLKTLLKYEFDIVVFNSILQDRKMFYYCNYLLKSKSKVFLTIHNINSWMNFGKFNIKNIIRFPLKKIIFNYSDGIILLNDKLKNYFDNLSNKKSVVIPFKIPAEKYINHTETSSDLVKFLIPGEIDQNKRDYNFLLEVFVKLFENFENIQLILLGKLNNNKIKKKLKKIKSKHPEKIKYFRKYIPQKEFKDEIRGSTFLISNMQRSLFYDRTCAKEYYGLSKASGIEFDAVKYAKPLIINSFYEMDNSFQNSTIYYENFHELQHILTKLMNNKKLIENKKLEAKRNSKIFLKKIEEKKIDF